MNKKTKEIHFNDTLQACEELHADQNLSLKIDESLCGLGVNGEHSCYVRTMFSINFPIRLFSIPHNVSLLFCAHFFDL